MKIAIQKAEEHEIGCVSAKDSGHFGVAGLFSMMTLSGDLSAMLLQTLHPLWRRNEHYGGRERIMGSNPLSYAFPAEKFPRFAINLSCSVVPAGKLIFSRKKREKILIKKIMDSYIKSTKDSAKTKYSGEILIPGVGAWHLQ